MQDNEPDTKTGEPKSEMEMQNKPIPKTLHFTLSPESCLDDLRALFDSYAIEVWEFGKLRISVPIRYLPCPPLAVPNRTIRLKLHRYEPPADEHEPSHTRWPFYVTGPVVLQFYLGDYTWEYQFTPGQTYEEREA